MFATKDTSNPAPPSREARTRDTERQGAGLLSLARLRDEARLLRDEYNFVIQECRAGKITPMDETALLTAIVRQMRAVCREMRSLVPTLP